MTNTIGGKALGSGGTVNYSVGQTFFNTTSSETGSVSEGVQQPFEIFTTIGIEINYNSLNMKIYPNPTTNILNLIVENFETGLSYQLFDVDGKILKTEEIQTKETEIEMRNVIPSSYFLRVINQEQIVKAFKIIKNN